MPESDDFLTLFLAHQRDLRAFVGSLVRDRAAQEDVLQEVALVLWRKFDEFDRSRRFGAWARGIAARKVLQRRAADERFPLAFSPEAVEALRDAFDRDDDGIDARMDALAECVETLPAGSRVLLDLRYQDDLPGHEIAERTGRTRDAVYQALLRIRDMLADCVARRVQRTEGAGS